MPPFARPGKRETFFLPPRTAVEGGRADVLVIGGGPAGLGAALGAAQAGAEVVLAERYGYLGGNATAALVMPFASWFTNKPAPKKPGSDLLLPSDHSEGFPVIGGALAQMVERLVQRGGALPPSAETGFTVPFDPEIFKIVALEMLDESGVRYLFHAFASQPLLREEALDGVVFETKSGPVCIRAGAFVDCTGDGDIAAHAGAPFEVGRDADRLVQPMSLLFLMAEFARPRFSEYVRKHPDQWMGVHGLWNLVQEASRQGDLNLPREDILLFATPRKRELTLNSTRVVKVLGTDVWDLTFAEWQSRRQMSQIAAFLKKYVPGFEQSFIGQSAATVGVRETRRIRGGYTLTAQDILGARKFEDAIAHGTYPIDIHNPTGKGTVLEPLPGDDYYDIPLRCLIPPKPENLLVAGRCISGTHEAQASYRIMPISMATGQAAGVCAALSEKEGRRPKQVPAADVQRELKRQGAILHP